MKKYGWTNSVMNEEPEGSGKFVCDPDFMDDESKMKVLWELFKPKILSMVQIPSNTSAKTIITLEDETELIFNECLI